MVESPQAGASLPESHPALSRAAPPASSPVSPPENGDIPTIRFRLVRNRPRELDHELLWGAIGLAGLIVAWLVPPSFVPLAPKCPFKHITGYPCMTCGGTRAAECFVHGRPTDALRLNPAVTAGLAVLVPYLVYAWTTVLLRTRRVRVSLHPPWSHLLRFGILAVVLLNWIYLVWDGR